jgi:hypothetical protein
MLARPRAFQQAEIQMACDITRFIHATDARVQHDREQCPIRV